MIFHMRSPNRPQDPPSALLWDEKHLKALLGLHRHPLRWIQVEPWQGWIKQRGGLIHVRQALRSAPLSPNQRALLDLILEHPDASVVFYRSRLNISQSSYFVYLGDLAQALLLQLNTWVMEPAARETALVDNTSTLPAVAVQRTSTNSAHHISTQLRLPTPLTPLIGAEESVTTVIAILQRPGVRLLTLTGPGGVGKTRLSIDVGTRLFENFRDGVFFVALETLSDPALLIPQIARTLNLENIGAQSLFDALKDYLRERQTLLILDNFEQLIEAGSLVVELLQAAAGLKVLTTSREALNQYGETRFVVPELTRPDPGNLPPLEQLDQWAAVDLFVQRVQALHPTFVLNESNKQAIVHICHRLDGLPLAIELAAAQVKQLAPNQVLPHLERGLKSLRDASRDRPLRQKTLWDAIDWSYQLLPETEKTHFRRLAVFGRTWSLEAAQAVCETSDAQADLEGLADKSLVRYTPPGEDGEVRFQMLQAVREYAFDRLKSSGESEATHRRHAAYFLMLVEQAERVIGAPEQLSWAGRIKQEHENLQIALQWMLDGKETEMAFSLLGAVWRYWDRLNVWSEAKLWMERALAQGAHLNSAGRVKTLWGASWLVAHQSDYAQSLKLAEQGLALARQLGEKRLVGLLLQNAADGAYRLGNNQQGIALVEESLSIFRELDDREEIAWALDHLARGLRTRGEHARSREVLQESLALFRGMGHQWATAYSLSHLGRLALDDNDDDVAAALLAESLELSKKMGAKQRISEILRELGLLTWRSGNLDQARAILAESLAISREIGDRTGEGWGLNRLGCMALEQADFVTARRLFEETQALFQKVGEPAAIASNLECLIRLELAENGQGQTKSG